MKATFTTIFKSPYWFWRKYDGRKKEFRGITKAEFEAAKERHFGRARANAVQGDRIAYVSRAARAKYTLWRFSSVPYEYYGDGYEDYPCYQRPSSNGRGYVAIAPGEPANNDYVDEPMVVAMLKRRYDKHFDNL